MIFPFLKLNRLFFWGLVFNTIILCLLLLQNPFSAGNSLSDLYPYPDSIHYINPAIGLLRGAGLAITREGRSIPAAVPPLYSVVLSPFYLFNTDPRMYYFANLILSLTGLYLFFQILKLLTGNRLIIISVLFLYATNFFIYWYPKLPMAENLSLPLFLAGLYLLFTKITKPKLILAGITGISFVAVKYALVPVALSFLFLYTVKVLLEAGIKKQTIPALKLLLLLAVSALLTFAVFNFSEGLYKGTDMLTRSKNLLKPLTVSFGNKISLPAAGGSNNPPVPFSAGYFSDGINQYLAGLIGGSLTFADFYRPIIPVFAGMPALAMLFYGLLLKRIRFICFSLLTILLVSVLFMSTFETVDGRYIYHSIPILLAGFTLGLAEAEKFLVRQKAGWLFSFILSGLAVYYILTAVKPVYTQLNQNIFGDKEAFNYQSVLQFNRYFQTNRTNSDKKPLVITGLIPYFVDFYSNGNYQILPMSTTAYFAYSPLLVWGFDYLDLMGLYDSYLKQGRDVYVSDSGIYFWDKAYLLRNFNKLKEGYDLAPVSKGCNGNCVLYKLQVKDKANLNLASFWGVDKRFKV